MRPHTRLGVGGVADLYLEITKMNNLIDAISIAREDKIPFLVLGEGNNSIFSDFGFPGFVIMNKTATISFLPDNSQVIVDSGVKALHLVMLAANRDLGGIEFLANFPGTIGSAIYNNISINKTTINQNLKKITIMSPRSEILTYKAAWLKPEPCSTRLKRDSEKSIILTAGLQLQRSRQEDIIRKIRGLTLAVKPDLHVSGPIFGDPTDKNAADLLKSAGANRLRVGDIVVNPNNCNQIINRRNGESNQARQCIEEMRQLVSNKHGIILEESIEYLGVW